MASVEHASRGARATGTSGLWYAAGGERRRVPAWAEAMVDLGAACATRGRLSAGERLIAAIAVPTRAYCAVLAAVGAVGVPEPPLSGEIKGHEALEAHFRELSALRPGTAVTVGHGTGVAVGKLMRVDETGAEPVLVIQQRDFVQTLPKRSCDRIRARGRYFNALLVGRIAVVEAEVRGQDVVTSTVKPLQTLLKVARFSSSAKGAKSEVVAPGYSTPSHLLDAQPGLIVFDGASSFRRAREEWRGRGSWLVVLDRSAPSFAEGVQLIEDEFVQRDTHAPDPRDLQVPEGCELMAFWSSR